MTRPSEGGWPIVAGFARAGFFSSPFLADSSHESSVSRLRRLAGMRKFDWRRYVETIRAKRRASGLAEMGCSSAAPSQEKRTQPGVAVLPRRRGGATFPSPYPSTSLRASGLG